jgi:hypothetical protein
VFTREAFEDYFDHLTPDGVLLITRPPSQLPKLFATARELFESRGLGSPAGHLLAFYAPGAPFGARKFDTGLLLKKSPFTADELRIIKERLGVSRSSIPSVKGDVAHLYYSPDQPELAKTDEFAGQMYEILGAPDLRSYYASTWIDFVPATDDRPFFNQPVRWASLRPWMVRQVFEQGRARVDVLPFAQVTLLILFVQAIAVAAFLILLPLARLSRQGLRAPRKWSFLTYFAGLGFGFIMIEMVFLQWFTLFLGEPVYTYAVVLASLLIFTGLGSFLTARFPQGDRRVLLVLMLILVAVLAATTIATPRIFTATLGLSLAWRVAIAVAVIAPLGVLLGMPFPTGLRIVAEEASALVPWAWGVNGFCTVIGSVGAMILAMVFGFKIVLAVAGACYLASLAAIMMPRIRAVRGTEQLRENRLSVEDEARSSLSFGPDEVIVGGR